MVKYASLVKQKLNTLSAWKLEHVPRDCNERADASAAVAASLPIRETVFPLIYYPPFQCLSQFLSYENERDQLLMVL